MKIDINAEIIPYKGLGGIELYSSINDLADIISSEKAKVRILGDNRIGYEINNCIELLFHSKNNKLFLIRTLEGYKGKLFGKIGVGSSEEEFLEIEPTFWYEDFEEVWISPKGIYIETDGATNLAVWISVFIPELESEDFEKCNW